MVSGVCVCVCMQITSHLFIILSVAHGAESTATCVEDVHISNNCQVMNIGYKCIYPMRQNQFSFDTHDLLHFQKLAFIIFCHSFPFV